ERRRGRGAAPDDAGIRVVREHGRPPEEIPRGRVWPSPTRGRRDASGPVSATERRPPVERTRTDAGGPRRGYEADAGRAESEGPCPRPRPRRHPSLRGNRLHVPAEEGGRGHPAEDDRPDPRGPGEGAHRPGSGTFRLMLVGSLRTRDNLEICY